jgi:hypothetical protein
VVWRERHQIFDRLPWFRQRHIENGFEVCFIARTPTLGLGERGDADLLHLADVVDVGNEREAIAAARIRGQEYGGIKVAIAKIKISQFAQCVARRDFVNKRARIGSLQAKRGKCQYCNSGDNFHA